MILKQISFLEIRKKLEAHSVEITSSINDQTIFNGINSISNANENEISFFSNIKYLDLLKNFKGKACIIKKNYIKYLPKSCQTIVVNEPYLAFAYIIELFNNREKSSNGIISKDAIISKETKIGFNVQIDPYVNLLDKTEISDNVIIKSNSVIGPNVFIGSNTFIDSNVSIKNAIIRDNCLIKSGARIGSVGFGFDEKSKKKIQHIGDVLIDKNCTIGSNTTIDRAVFESTSIGEYSQIDNLVQIAHNVNIGKHAIIAAQVGIAGSAIIGDYVKIGGQAGISGHLFIGNNVTIAGKSGVTKNISDNKVVAGFPAKDINDWKREIIKNKK